MSIFGIKKAYQAAWQAVIPIHIIQVHIMKKSTEVQLQYNEYLYSLPPLQVAGVKLAFTEAIRLPKDLSPVPNTQPAFPPALNATLPPLLPTHPSSGKKREKERAVVVAE